MFTLVLTCLILSPKVFGYSSIKTTKGEVYVEGSRTFDSFQESNWNPINWFNRDSGEDRNEQKLDALYKTIECLVRNDPKECVKFINDAKIHFEKPKDKKKKDKNQTNTSTTPTTSTTSTTSAASTTSTTSIPQK